MQFDEIWQIDELRERTETGAHIILVGNEKGGSGKTTLSMHISAYLLAHGYRVGTMDLDVRQRSLTRYVENRRAVASKSSRRIALPDHAALDLATGNDLEARHQFELKQFIDTLALMKGRNDYIVIDSPGSDTYLSRMGHAFAQTLITPMNESFVDFDLLAHVDTDTLEVREPSIYAEMIWECRKARARADGTPIDWVVVRNRTTHIHSRNRARVDGALKALANRLGFREIQGLSERAIFREMFPAGLTLLDLTMEESNRSLTMSHVAARAEMAKLISDLNLPDAAPALRADETARLGG